MRPLPRIRKVVRKVVRRDSTVVPRMPTPPPDRMNARVWHVWIEGGEPVGPVSPDQIARGIQAGKVPTHASVRHETDTFWTDVLDVPDVIEALKARSAESEPPPAPIAPNLQVRQYMVWISGGQPVGPVSADQIARGIRAGKVPSDASLQRVGEFFASDVLDEPEVIAALKHID
jgi:hypothetical protein